MDSSRIKELEKEAGRILDKILVLLKDDDYFEDYFAIIGPFLKAQEVKPEELKQAFLEGDPIADSKLYNYFFTFPRWSTAVAEQQSTYRFEVLSYWKMQLGKKLILTSKEKELLSIIKDIEWRYLHPSLDAKSLEKFSSTLEHFPRIIDLDKPNDERLKLGDPYACLAEAKKLNKLGRPDKRKINCYLVISIKAGLPDGLAMFGDSFRVGALTLACYRYSVQYHLNRNVDHRSISGYAVALLIQIALANLERKHNRDILYHAAATFLIDASRYKNLPLKEQRILSDCKEPTFYFNDIREQFSILADREPSFVSKLLSQEPDEIKPMILSLLRPDIVQKIRVHDDDIVSRIKLILELTPLHQFGAIFSALLCEQGDADALFRVVSNSIQNVISLDKIQSLDVAKEQLTLAQQQIFQLMVNLDETMDKDGNSPSMLAMLVRWLEVAECRCAIQYKLNEPYPVIGLFTQTAKNYYELKELEEVKGILSSTKKALCELQSLKPDVLLPLFLSNLQPLIHKRGCPDLIREHIKEIILKLEIEIPAASAVKAGAIAEKKR